ncbi:MULTISPECIES: major capsid protein [Pelosinus]|uniref:Major capsid protein E n=1 Tax=Pelosinus fermentans B4 TaxID=1149862 RepID=I9LHD8_9FIRM|nr:MULTISPECIES: major capsid protein [Pelosinus]EIW19919.1 major capsid protein E [Pelosinus fermentans B4]EIW21224.1 hypothetical protein FA11_0951 [Pelosinus fermentans A11]
MAGLAQYSEYFQNPLFSETIQEVPVKKGYIGSRFLPNENTYDIDFNETVLTRQADMADIVDSGAELPLTDRDPVRRVSGEITDIGQSYIVTKKELAALQDKGNAGRRAIAEKQLLGKAALIKGNLDARMEWMKWQAMGTGQLAYNKGGIKLGVDFGVTNIEVAAVKWNAATPTILADYEAWVQDYVDLNGFSPDVYVTSIAAIRVMMNDVALRKAITGYSDKVLTIDELNTFLVSRQMPKVEAFDSLVTYRDVDSGGARVTQRLLDAKKGVFLKEGGEIGSLLLGPTVENSMNPGMYAHTIDQQRPMRSIIEVVAAAFPKIMEPNYITITTVLA